ncbi:hypothetical protein HYS94_01710 [Candidatus Daviesbacteria bacterium]|nr:hypothetical protein [Candidatus Daviesbacteria bacterium]
MSIDRLFKDQVRFTDKIINDLSVNVSKTELIKEYLLSLHDELSEILHCTNWKWHREDYGSDIDYENLYVELIDTQKFLWGLMHICGMDINKFEEVYDKKSKIVEERLMKLKGKQ